jgi:hypothetical protein
MIDLQIDELIGEYKIPGEDEIIRDYVRLFEAHFQRHYLSKGLRPRRAIHAKSHGYLSAVFEVIDHCQPDFRHSIFKEPATYKAVVRISNGDGPPGPDTDRIASVGFAIKVVGVMAKKYLAAQTENSQDFLFLNQPAYIAADVRDYKSLMEAIDGGPFYQLLALMRNFWGILYRLKASPKDDPLNTNFWGVAPFKLGDVAVKYLIRPSVPEGKQVHRLTNDYLTELVKSHIEDRDANFDFFLQKRLLDGGEAEMPIEDYSVAWNETRSAPVRAGRLLIPAQRVGESLDQQAVENLSFSPWNTTYDLRPLGSLNRARRVIYEFSSRQRHEFGNLASSGPGAPV